MQGSGMGPPSKAPAVALGAWHVHARHACSIPDVRLCGRCRAPSQPPAPLPPWPLASQMRVIGATMGAWGKEKYGMKPKKVEALEFHR